VTGYRVTYHINMGKKSSKLMSHQSLILEADTVSETFKFRLLLMLRVFRDNVIIRMYMKFNIQF
jgi:hypothetical protein